MKTNSYLESANCRWRQWASSINPNIQLSPEGKYEHLPACQTLIFSSKQYGREETNLRALKPKLFDFLHSLIQKVCFGVCLFCVTLVACRAQVISADTQPISLRTLLLLMSALQDRFLRMLETTWWSSSLSEANWATRAWRQLFFEHRLAWSEEEEQVKQTNMGD